MDKLKWIIILLIILIGGMIFNMGLDFGNQIFPTARDAEDEFFISEAEKALKPRIVVKAADQSLINDTTINDDDELFMNLSADSIYEFEVFVEAVAASVTPDLRYSFKGPTGSIGRFWETLDDNTIKLVLVPTVLETTVAVSLDTDPDFWYAAKGWVKTGSNAGTLIFKWAQLNSSADFTRIKAGSWMKVTKQ